MRLAGPDKLAPAMAAEGAGDRSRLWSDSDPVLVAAAVLTIAAACAALLALPGQTVTTKYVNDLFVFLDGAHRVLEGQVPNRDFHSALGPLTYYLPAAGMWLGGNYGAAMPIGMALTVMGLAGPAAHILGTRLRPVIAIPLALYLLLIAAAPINLGEPVRALSFAMFYNRVGWAALAFLLVMYVRPTRTGNGQTVLDVLSAAALALLLLYLKISYGLVALAFLLFMLLDPHQRRWAILALGLMAAICLGIEAMWRSSGAHISDLLLAGRVSGAIKSVEDVGEIVIRSFAGYVPFAMVAGLALWRRRRVRDLLFYGFCTVSGYMLVKQNFNNWDIVTLGAAAAVGAEFVCRSALRTPAASPGQLSVLSGIPILLLALTLPSSVHNATALGLHAALATAREGEPVPLPEFQGIRLAKLWSAADHPAMQAYAESLKDGADALGSLHPKPSRVFVLDFVSPFSAGLGLKPPVGDSTWQHWGRTVDDAHFLPPKDLLSDVRVIMEPKFPVEIWTAEGLRRVYGRYIAERFELARETPFWKVYVAKSAEDGSGAPSAIRSRSASTD